MSRVFNFSAGPAVLPAEDGLGGALGGQGLLRVILAPGDDGQRAPGAAVRGIDVHAQHVVGLIQRRKFHPFIQRDLLVHLPRQVDLLRKSNDV